MPGAQWRETIVRSTAEGAALGNTVTATSLLPGTAKPILPLSQLLSQVGTVLEITAAGRCSNIVTTPGTLTFDIRMGTGPVIVFDGTAMALNIVAKTNVSWLLKIILTLRAIGNGTLANFIGKGFWESESVVGAAAGTAGTILLPPTSTGAVGTGFDSTSSTAIDLFAKWSIANAGNTLVCEQFLIEHLTNN